MSGFVFPPGLNLLERKTKEIVSGGKEAAKADFLKIISENIVKIMNSLLLKENLYLTTILNRARTTVAILKPIEVKSILPRDLE
jgi:hypothetical protein